MKTVIAALNSKYIHMSLAPWCLRAACGDGCGEIKIIETTVNRSTRDIMRAIYEEKPDLLGFSCYIFNIIQIERIVNEIKKLMPDLKIVLGGPEVSYDAREVLARCPGADYVVCGEGERAFAQLAQTLSRGGAPGGIAGLTLRGGGGGAVNAQEDPAGAEGFPSPYTDGMLAQAEGRIIYFESSRGCPFGCSYCLSSESRGVRFFDMAQVKAGLSRVMRSGARQVKFVDRTFNCSLPRAKEIIRHIIDSAKNDGTGVIARKNFHFEAAADLFDDELLGLLGSAPRGLIQLEIGIQSLNEETLAAVGRKTDIEKCRRNIKSLLEGGNIHIHLDLIAGLPHEDYACLARSFDGVFELRPHTIQLGFLKLLKGSRMRREPGGLLYESLAPYEVLRTPALSFGELSVLHDVAECVERLWNSGRFRASLGFAVGLHQGAFAFFEAFSAFLSQRGCFERSLSLRELYDLFAAYADASLSQGDAPVLRELLKFDYFSTDNACNPPAGLTRVYDPTVKGRYLALKDETPPAGGRVHFESFGFDPLLFIKGGGARENRVLLRFDYGSKDPVSGLYPARAIQD